MDGYIKLHRKILDNPVVCKDAEYFSVWLYLLLNATHKEFPALFKGEKIVLQPGQLITGRLSIAEQFNISESKVKRILISLENDQQIERQRSNQNSLITILNWNTYQQSDQQNDQPVTSQRPASDQPVTTNKNVKNVRTKEINNNIPSNEFAESSFEIQIVNSIILSCKELYPNSKVPVTISEKSKWAAEIEKMIRLDKRTEDEIQQALWYAITDTFWKGNIRSAKKFREKFETLIVQSRKKEVQNVGPGRTVAETRKPKTIVDLAIEQGGIGDFGDFSSM